MTQIPSSELRAGSPRPIRVLLVGPSLDILGGQAVQAARLLARFQQEPELEAAFLPVNPRLPGPLRLLQRIKYVRTIATSIAYVALLLARVWRYDIIHVFSASYFSFLLAPTPAILIARLYRKRIVLNYRSGEAEDHLQRWRRTAIPTIRLTDSIIVCSGYLIDVFAKFGLPATAIFNTIDTTRYAFRPRPALRPVFLSNRNLEPLYNVACVLRAFAGIQKQFPEARLTIAGDGSQRAELEQLAQTLGLRHTEFIGRVPPDQMPALYDAADIYLNSPNIDNMPGSILEAFASGLPVVTTNAGGIPYIVRDGEIGIMVNCDDHEAMARGAIRLLEDAAFAARIIANAHAECARYAWPAAREAWLRAYNDLAQSPRTRRLDSESSIREVSADG